MEYPFGRQLRIIGGYAAQTKQTTGKKLYFGLDQPTPV